MALHFLEKISRKLVLASLTKSVIWRMCMFISALDYVGYRKYRRYVDRLLFLYLSRKRSYQQTQVVLKKGHAEK